MSWLNICEDTKGYIVENNTSGSAKSARLGDQMRTCEKCGFRFHRRDHWDRLYHFISCRLKRTLFGAVNKIVAPLRIFSKKEEEVVLDD